MQAIILVAGLGTRLKPLTDEVPKCLTEVHGKAILDNTLEALEANGIKKVSLVIGYLGDTIRKRVGDKYGNMDVCYIENDRYDRTNTSYSLYLAIKELSGDTPLLVLEGDIYFEPKLLRNLLRDEYPTSTTVQKYAKGLDGTFVGIKSSLVVDWIHVRDRDDNFVIEDMFKTVNIHKFAGSFVRDHLMPALSQNIRDEEGKEPIERVMRDIVKNRGGIVNVFDAERYKWYEIDDIHDLRTAERIFK